MNHQAFKRALTRISRLSAAKDYDAALEQVESLLKTWPGNPHAQVLRATFLQLQEHPSSNLDDVKRILHEATELDAESPAAAIELGHFLDAVEDDPKQAAKVFDEAVHRARQLLIEALIGQARVLLQLDKRQEAIRCLAEILRLSGDSRSGRPLKSSNAKHASSQTLWQKDNHATKIDSLLNEVLAL